jgi:hypothetical protein
MQLNRVLISKLTHISLHLFVQTAQLLIQDLFLSQTPLEHLNFVSELIILELVLVGFASDFLVALLPQLLELSLLALFELADYFLCLFQLHPQVFYQTVLVVF